MAKRTTFWITGSILAIVLVLAVVYAFRHQLIAPLIENRLIAELESRYGVRVAIGSIGGTYLTNLELNEVNAVAIAPESPVSALAIRNGAISYSVLDLLGGIGQFLANADLALTGARLDLDLDRFPKDGKAGTGPPSRPPPPASLPDLLVRDSQVSLKFRGFNLAFAGLEAALRTPGPARLEVRADKAAFVHPRIAEQAGPFVARLVYTGDRLAIESLDFGTQLRIEQAGLDLTGPGRGDFTLQAIVRLLAGEIHLQASLAETTLAGELRARGLDLGTLSALLPRTGLPELAGRLQGVAQWQVNPTRPAETLQGLIELDLEEGRVRGRLGADHLALRAEAAGEEIVIRHLEGRIADNDLTIQGIGIPAAVLFKRQWSRLLDASQGSFSLRFSDIPALLRLAGVNKAEWQAQIPRHTLTMEGSLGRRALSITQGSLETESGQVRIRQAALQLPPPPISINDTAAQGELDFNIPRLSELAAIFGLPSLRGTLAGQAALEGTLGAPQGSARAKGTTIIYREVPFGDLELALAADRSTITMSPLQVRRGDDRLDGRGTLRLADRFIDNLALRFSIEEVDHYLAVLPAGIDLSGALKGSLDARGPLDRPEIRLQATLTGGRLKGLAVQTATVDLHHQDRTLDISRAEVETAYGALSLQGSVNLRADNRLLEARLASLRLAAAEGATLQLIRPAQLAYATSGVLSLQEILLRGSAGEILIDGKLGRQTDSDLRMRLSGLNSEGWLELLAGDRFSFSGLDALLDFQGALAAPSFRIEGQVAALRSPEVPFPIDGAFDLGFTRQGLAIRRFELHGRDNLNLTLTGTLPLNPWQEELFQPGAISLSGRLEMPTLRMVGPLLAADLDLEGRLGGDIELAGTWRQPQGRLQLSGWDLRLAHPDVPDPPHPFNISADVAVRGNELELNGFRVASPDFTGTATGDWTGGPALQNLLRGRDLRLAGDLALRAQFRMPDIGWVARDIPQLRRLAGALQADLDIRGPVRDPEVEGTIQLADGELRTTWAFPPLQNLQVKATLDERRLLLESANGELGSAPFSLSGTILREEGGPVLDLALQGSNLLLFRNEWITLRANSDLQASGPIHQLQVGGGLAITSGFYRKNVDFLGLLRGSEKPRSIEGLRLFSIRKGPLRDMTFDVKITAENPFRIKNNLINGSVRPELRLAGTGELPVLLGRIYVDESRISLPTTRLLMETGLIQFRENRPFSPEIDLLAQGEMAGYDINMQIEGSYTEPVVTLSSMPPLPPDDLLLLLLAGKLPQNGREAARTGGLNVAMYVGRGLLADWFSGDTLEDDPSLLERLEVEVGRGITQKGQETLDAQLQIAEDLLGKDDTLYLTAERDIYDEFNVGIKIIFQLR